MNIKLKMLKAWTHKPEEGDEIKANAGDVVEVSKELAADLLLDGTAKRYDEAEEKAAADAKKAEREETVKALAEAIKEGAKDDKGIRVTYMHEKSDDDPFAGFLPGFAGKTADASAGQRAFAAGNFAKHVFAAGKQNGSESELLKVSKARAAEQIEKAAGTGLQVQADEDVGYAIPPALNLSLLTQSEIAQVVRPRATVITLDGQSVNLPRTKDYDHSSNLVHGGVIAYWEGEDDQLASSKPKMEKVGLNLHKLAALAYASDETMKFSPFAVGSYLLPKMQDAITFAEDNAFINGTGAGQPQGIIGASATLQINKESGQAAATIVYENVLKAYARLKVFREGSVVWLANRAILPQLATMSVTVGTGGAPVYLPANGASGMPYATLMGHPVVYTEYCPTLGTAGDLVLCDMSRYLVADHSSGADIAQSMHLKFDYAQMAFRILKYTDGRAEDSTTYTPKAGDSKGVFVKIQTRS